MKHRYAIDDVATFYFVTQKDPRYVEPLIKAFTDDKALLDFYLEFHNVDKNHVMHLTDTYQEICKIINSKCRYDEITMVNLITANRSKHSGKTGDVTTVILPLTEAEHLSITDDRTSFGESRIDYSGLHEIIGKFKGKYCRALANLGLIDVINKTVMNKESKFTNNITIDEVIMLIKFFPDQFG